MSGGGSQSMSTTETPLSAFSVQSSAYGLAQALIYGRNRVAGNLIWYGDFQAIPHTTANASSGGKGGASTTSTSTSFTYRTSFVLGLGAGPAHAINAYWVDKEYHSDANVFTKFLGTDTQIPWSYLNSQHPVEALAYRGLISVAAADYDLGTSASLGNHNFDVTGHLPFDAGTIDGADPAAVIFDAATDQTYGARFDTAFFASLSDYSDYCVANGIFLSPVYEQQIEARQAITDLIELTNAGIFFSEGKIKIVPYSDAPATGNGATFTPSVTIAYDLGEDDFLDLDQPVHVLRNQTTDAYNEVKIEYLDKANQYNTAIVTVQDQASIETFGLRSMAVVTAHSITDAETARLVAQIIMQRVLYIRNTYEFKIGWKYARLESCDYVTLTESHVGLDAVPVRILTIEENEDGELACTAEDAPSGIHSSPLYDTPSGLGYTVNYSVDPGDIVTPAFFEMPPAHSLSGLSIGIAVTGNSIEWGGCEVWASNDGDSYTRMGQAIGGARYGTIGNAITAAIGQQPRVTLVGNGGKMLTGSTADANNLSTLCLIDNEFVAHTGATLVAANVYDLTLAVRGAYETTSAAHAIGTKFIRVDDAVINSEALSLDRIGSTVNFKFLSYNRFGGGKKRLADVTAYAYTITGAMAKLAPPTISAPEAMASENSIMLSWTTPDDAMSKRTEIWCSDVDDVDTATLAGAVTGPVGFFAHYLGSAGLTRFYWLRTINAQGFPSAYTASVTATTGQVTANPADGSVSHSKLAADSVWAGNIKAGEIQTPHLAAGIISAGSGKIGALAVDTLMIADNAVTIPVFAENTTSFSNQSLGTGYSSYYDFISASITMPQDGCVVAQFSAETTFGFDGTGYHYYNAGAGNIQGGWVAQGWVSSIDIYVDDSFYTRVATGRVAGARPSTMVALDSFSRKINLSAGSHTVIVRGNTSGPTSSAMSVSKNAVSLLLLGIMK